MTKLKTCFIKQRNKKKTHILKSFKGKSIIRCPWLYTWRPLCGILGCRKLAITVIK